MSKTENDEDYKEELRWRLEVLKTLLNEDKFRIAGHLWEETNKSLSRVRYGSDGKIDLDTVDGRVRSMALMAAHTHQRQQAKDTISLSDISQIYFEFVEKNFGFLREEARKMDANANEFAHIASRTPLFVKDFAGEIPKLIETLKEFWESTSDAAHYHIQDIQDSKAVFGGDLFPSYQRNIASTAGLYVDTIVLSDPFWHSRHVFESTDAEKQVYYLVKHALNVLNYKELATAGLPNPIVAFAPFQTSVDEAEKTFLHNVMIQDGLKHAGRLFGKTFEGSDELWDFCSKLKTPDEVVAELADPARLLFDTEWKEPLSDQILRSLDSEWSSILGAERHAGKLVAGQCFGRMGQATDLLMRSRYLGGVPLIDAPTSWEYFNWKLEYNSAIEAEENTPLHMIKGLQRAAATDEQWLGNIPPAALIEMRKTGAFEEIRNVLSGGVAEIAIASPENFFRSTDRIVDNLRDAFEKHMNEVRQLRDKKIKFAGYEVGTMLVAGAIDIASIATGLPTFGAASFAVNQLVDAPKLREIPERFRTLKNAHNELKKSPMGLLFRHKSKP